MLRWFESRIDPFASKTINQPPSLLRAFYWYFIKPIWPAFALLVFLDFLAALTEVALATFVAILIDLMKVTQLPAAFIGDHAGLLIAMGFFVIVARPTLVLVMSSLKIRCCRPHSRPAPAGRRIAICVAFFKTTLRAASPIN
jgi:hypothetical protein